MSVQTAHHGAIARLLLDEADQVGDQMVRAILDAAPALADDPVLAHDTAASTRANLLHWVAATVARPADPVPIEVPVEAFDLARDIARRGMAPEPLFVAYRHGHNLAWQAYLRAAGSSGLAAAELVDVLELASASLFRYVDGVLAAISERIEQERDDLVDGALAHRRETVLLLLDGAPMTAAEATARLGYEIATTHLALVLFHDEGIPLGDLERHAGALGRHLGTGRPLTVPAGRSALWVWLSGRDLAGDDLDEALEGLPDQVRIAAGSTGVGAEGFRASHLEAREAQRLLLRSPDHPARAHFDELRAVALAAGDEDRARAFAAAVLGDLERADPVLRDTVRTYLALDHSATGTAEALFTHRNTILKRLARADGLLPTAIAGHGLDLALALEIVRWLGPGGS